MSETPTPTVTATPERLNLALLNTRDFTKHIAGINVAYETARKAHEQATETLGNALTEQITRHVTTLYPDAALLYVRSAAEFCSNDDMSLDMNCTGHNERLVPAEITTTTGETLGYLDDLSPVVYWLERLAPQLGTSDHVLELTSRTWAYGLVEDEIL